MSSNFAIVNLKDGVRRDRQSFLIENDSFPILENAYLFRGRIQRRSCFSPVGELGRLNGTVGTTAGSPFAAPLLNGPAPGGIPVGVASFRIGSVILTDQGGASPVTLITTDPLYAGSTLDRATGALSINHPVIPATAVIYVPGLPVMGLETLEDDSLINDEGLFGFDTRYSYLFNSGTNDFTIANTFTGTTNTFVWTGQDYEQFWSTNYAKAFWVTNNNAGFHAAQNASPVAERDGIRWYGTVSPGATRGWSNFNPAVDTTNFLTGGLIIVAYKNRLIVLNSLEGTNLAGSLRYPQRARFSQNGTPFYGQFPTGGSAQADAWRSDIVGKGGFIDAPTQEAIVSAEFIKDTLIVYFERSTWQLVYTANETLPFVFQKINTELGSESSFSIIPFDSGVFAIGNYGIITTDSTGVQRIDQKIPDEVFQIQNTQNGVKRVSGVRDYNSQLAYWSYPIKSDEDGEVVTYTLTYPNQVLVYNYLEGSWAEFDDCFTTFGYFQKTTDTTWARLRQTWASTNFAWNSQVLEAKYPDVIAGNQRGFVMVFSQIYGLTQNSPSIPISNVTAATKTMFCPDHNFVNNQFVLLTALQGVTSNRTSGTPNNVVYKIIAVDVNNITLETQLVNVPAVPDVWSGTYTGGGLLTHIPGLTIQTKEFNPFYQQGDGIRANYIDIYMDRTTQGAINAQFFTSDNTSLPVEEVTVLTSADPQPSYVQPPTTNYSLTQNKVWHRIYTNSFGSFVQNVFTLNDAQMRDLTVASSGITIHGLIYYVSPAGRLSYDI